MKSIDKNIVFCPETLSLLRRRKVEVCPETLSLLRRGEGEVRKVIAASIIYIMLLFQGISFPQTETVPADHQVYDFLKEMNLKGALPEYNDIILPLSKSKVTEYLIKLDENKKLLNSSEIELLGRMKEKFFIKEEAISIADNFPEGFSENLSSDNQKHLYFYSDSSINFYADPLLDYKFIYSDYHKTSSSLFNYGGRIKGSYNNWLGFSLTGTLGIQFGSREVSRIDRRVLQSFSFNDTENQYFDDTEGYLRLAYGIAEFQFGREKQLWGNGYIDKMFISDNSPKFDFFSIGLAYKSLSYKMLCAWLVHPTDTVFVDSIQGFVKQKPSKYMVIGRLGFQPGRRFSAGITQVIIYSHRPFEAAYLNPFLFWESAQRSLNDLDNSMLNFDARYLITDGLELSASFIFDDIRSSNWFNGKWNAVQNRNAWQAGAMITAPLLPENFSLKVEYLQLRPYVFTHFGLTEEALTYTNNGYFIGVDLQPNSTRLSAELKYRASAKLNFTFLLKHSLHGANIYDAEGNLVTSYGGDIFRPITAADPGIVKILDGSREENNFYSFKVNYELNYGVYLSLLAAFEKFTGQNQSINKTWFWSSVILNLE